MVSLCEEAQGRMDENMVPMCTSTWISSTQEMMSQTEHPRTEEYQAWALSTLFEGLSYPSYLGYRPHPLLRDASVPIPGLALVVAQLS